MHHRSFCGSLSCGVVVVFCVSFSGGCGLGDDAVLDRWRSCEPPSILGHRGTRQMAPENTLPAFEWAMEHGADGIELDVETTRDGVLVVMHDATTGRTTDDGDDRKVSKTDFAELRLLDAGSWFGPEFRHTKIPTLQEAVDVAGPDALIDIDHIAVDNVDAVAAFIDEAGIKDRVVVSSYDEVALSDFALRAPDVASVLFIGDVSIDDLADVVAVQGAVARPRYVRVPKDIDEDPRALAIILEAGYLPATSGTNIQWVGGLAYADDVVATRDRLDERKPLWCE